MRTPAPGSRQYIDTQRIILRAVNVSQTDSSPLNDNMISVENRTQQMAPSDAADSAPLWSVNRYVKAPALSPDGSLLACIIVERDDYPSALQIPLDSNGEPIPGAERPVVLPIKGSVRSVLYSPDGKWLACEAAPDGGDHEQIWFVTTDPEDKNAYTVDMTAHETVELVSWEDTKVAYSAYHSDGTVEGKLSTPSPAILR